DGGDRRGPGRGRPSAGKESGAQTPVDGSPVLDSAERIRRATPGLVRGWAAGWLARALRRWALSCTAVGPPGGPGVPGGPNGAGRCAPQPSARRGPRLSALVRPGRSFHPAAGAVVATAG